MSFGSALDLIYFRVYFGQVDVSDGDSGRVDRWAGVLVHGDG